MSTDHSDQKTLDAHAALLDSITSETINDHAADPKSKLQMPATHPSSHAWLAKHLPASSLASYLPKAALASTADTYANQHHFGNYVINRETGEKTFEPMSIYVRVGMHLLYYGSYQSKLLHLNQVQELLEEQSRKMGAAYDAPESKAHIQPFIDSFALQDSLFELAEPDPTKYPTFNHFFARPLKPNARTVQDSHIEGVVCSPADCRLTAFPTIDLATKYWIKGQGFTLGKLLGDESRAADFDGGSMVIARLAPQDYHRWHSPVNGSVEYIQEIPGAYYTVNPQAINESTTLDVFCENRRSVMGLRRKETGKPVAVVAVGAMLVGSVRYDEGIKEGVDVERAQGLGAFYYGGSTVIVVYPPGEIVLDDDLVRNSTEEGCETQMKVGWSTGRSKV